MVFFAVEDTVGTPEMRLSSGDVAMMSAAVIITLIMFVAYMVKTNVNKKQGLR